MGYYFNCKRFVANLKQRISILENKIKEVTMISELVFGVMVRFKVDFLANLGTPQIKED